MTASAAVALRIVVEGAGAAATQIQNVGNAVARVDRASRPAVDGAAKLSAAIGRVAHYGLAGGGLLLVSNAIADAGKAMFEASAAAQRLATTLNFASGGNAAGELSFLRALTDRLGIGFNDAAGAYAKFQAAARGTSLAGAGARDVFESIAGASATLGLSAADTSGVLLALQQMISKGTVQAEELRGQLGERLPGAFSAASRAMGVTEAELGKMLERGEVLAVDLLPKLARVLKEDFAGAAESAATRLDAASAQLGNAFTRLKQALGDAGVSRQIGVEMKALAAEMNAVSDAMKVAQVEGSGALGQWAIGITTLLGRLTPLRYLTDAFDPLATRLANAEREFAQLQQRVEQGGGLDKVGIYLRSALGDAERTVQALRNLQGKTQPGAGAGRGDGSFQVADVARRRETEQANAEALKKARELVKSDLAIRAEWAEKAKTARKAYDAAIVAAGSTRERQVLETERAATERSLADQRDREIEAASKSRGARALALLEASNRAALEASGRRAAIASDLRERELAELQRGLDRETVALDVFYAEKRARAEADIADQIALKRQEIAGIAALPASDAAEMAQRRGQQAKLLGEIEQLQIKHGFVSIENAREQEQKKLELTEQAERRRLAILQRGTDDAVALTRAARAAGEIDAAALAEAEALAAEERVQIEIRAAERILAARRAAGATAEQIREGEDALEAARSRRSTQRSDTLGGVAERVRQLRESTRDIRLQLDADPARQAIGEAERDIERLREKAETDRATLKVQLGSATDARERERIGALMSSLDAETADAIVARNDQLADRLKPGWQKMVEGWRDAQRLMRDAADETMDRLLKGGEDAFVQLAQTGKLNLKSLVKDLQAIAGRTVWRQLIGSAQGQQGTNWLADLLGATRGLSVKNYSGREGDPNFMGPLPESASATADAMNESADAAGKMANAAQASADASTMQAAAAAANALGFGELGQVMQLATMAVTLFEVATKAAAMIEMATAAAATGAVFTGANRFAAGGAFTNSVVGTSTLFRFRHGGRWRLGEMGEAGPEAIVPLTRRGGALEMDAVDESGKPVRGGVRLARGRGGRLSAVLAAAPARHADGGWFGAALLAAPAVQFASGGVMSRPMQDVALRAAPVTGAASGLTLTQNINVAPGAGRNEVMLAMQQAKVAAVAEMEQRMQRNRAGYR